MLNRTKMLLKSRKVKQRIKHLNVSLGQWLQVCIELNVKDGRSILVAPERLVVQGSVDGTTFRIQSRRDAWLLESPFGLQHPWAAAPAECTITRGTQKDLTLSALTAVAVAALRE